MKAFMNGLGIGVYGSLLLYLWYSYGTVVSLMAIVIFLVIKFGN